MDYQTIVTAVVTAVLSISAVSVFLGKFIPKISGWVALAKDGVETINDISQALNPDPLTGKIELTPEEIAKINSDASSFKSKLAALLAK